MLTRRKDVSAFLTGIKYSCEASNGSFYHWADQESMEPLIGVTQVSIDIAGSGKSPKDISLRDMIYMVNWFCLD